MVDEERVATVRGFLFIEHLRLAFESRAGDSVAHARQQLLGFMASAISSAGRGIGVFDVGSPLTTIVFRPLVSCPSA